MSGKQVKTAGEMNSVKSCLLFCMLILTLIFNLVAADPAVGGSAVGWQAGKTALSRGVASSPVPESADAADRSDMLDVPEDDGFDADIFQAEQVDQRTHDTIADPLEGLNRAIFVFNDTLHGYCLQPVARGYARAVPTFARRGVKNFFDNLCFPVRFVNSLLQGKGEAAGREFCAFFINTTLGFGGLNDFAQKYVGIRLQDEDFGQTLGSYGIGNGFYLVLPVLGPSSLRDVLGTAGDRFINPVHYAQPWELSWGGAGLEKVNRTSFHIGEYDAFKAAAIDPYTAMRHAYIQSRNALINDMENDWAKDMGDSQKREKSSSP